MTFWTLILRGLRYHARAHAGVVLGAAIGTAALAGALVVGDSVRDSLRDLALARLGGIHFALNTQDRLFEANLAARLAALPPESRAGADAKAPGPILPSSARPWSVALVLPGVASKQDGSARANRVSVLGVDAASWPRMAGWDTGLSGMAPNLEAEAGRGGEVPRAAIAPAAGPLARWQRGEVAFLNESLARQLAVRPGDEIVVRVHKPSALGLDAAISPRDDSAIALRLEVGAIVPAKDLGDLGFSARQTPGANLFLPIEFLRKQAGLDVGSAKPEERNGGGTPGDTGGTPTPLNGGGRANLMVFGPARQARSGGGEVEEPVPDEQALPWLAAQLRRAWLPEDAQIAVRTIAPPPSATGGELVAPQVEVASARIFLDPPIINAALRPRTLPSANGPASRGDATNAPAYSDFAINGTSILTYLANLLRSGDRATPYSMVAAANGRLVPPDLRNDEMLVNQWLAENLKVQPGDRVELSYYVVDSGSRLLERTNSFRVRAVVPMKGVYADRTLMPEFPGVPGRRAPMTGTWVFRWHI